MRRLWRRRAAPDPAASLAVHEAPRGWKCAVPVSTPDGSGVELAGISVGGAYHSEDTAVCTRGRAHAAPDWHCECGFYAFADRGEATRLLGTRAANDSATVISGLCEVDLHGTVIRHQHGYRAERQRVLSLQLLPYCADCASVGLVAAPAVLAGGAGASRFGSSVTTSAHAAFAARGRVGSAPRRGLRPLCEPCSTAGASPGSTFTIVDAAATLGTEVRWLPRDAVPVQRAVLAHQMAGFPSAGL